MPMLTSELQASRHRWWLFLLLGIALVVLGLFALGAMVDVTLFSVIYFGCLLLIDGVAHVVSAFSSRIGGGFFLHLLGGILDVVVGLVMITRPAVVAETLTVLLALFFLTGGLFRAIAAVGSQYPGWGVTVLSGAVGVALGVIILLQWADGSSLYIIGLFVGIELLSRGFSWIITALGLRRLHEMFPEKT